MITKKALQKVMYGVILVFLDILQIQSNTVFVYEYIHITENYKTCIGMIHSKLHDSDTLEKRGKEKEKLFIKLPSCISGLHFLNGL